MGTRGDKDRTRDKKRHQIFRPQEKHLYGIGKKKKDPDEIGAGSRWGRNGNHIRTEEGIAGAALYNQVDSTASFVSPIHSYTLFIPPSFDYAPPNFACIGLKVKLGKKK